MELQYCVWHKGKLSPNQFPNYSAEGGYLVFADTCLSCCEKIEKLRGLIKGKERGQISDAKFFAARIPLLTSMK